jgi:predicted MPP superfamily phosphohydrolase
VYSDKIRREIKIVLITDLHSHIYGKNQKNIAKKIQKLNPDLILLGGDIIDDLKPVGGAMQFLDAVKGIADVYYVTGNHDMVMSRIVKNLKETIRSHGVTVLEYSCAEVNINGNDIIIGGADDPGINRKYSNVENVNEKESIWEKNIEAAFKNLKHDGRYKILLSHRPEKTELYAKLPFDLILSGHAHGGQVRIPFILNGLFAPQQGFFPKYAGGLYEYGGKVHIVSRGVAFSSITLPRVFNPPEIVAVTLYPKPKN